MWSDRVIEEAVSGMGFELVDVEWAGGGILRVFIDRPDAASDEAGAGGVNVDDCARVSDQLSRVFAVENVNYERLEISSPGLDRPLKKPADFVRFEGHEAFVKLRVPPDGQPRGRRQFQGILQHLPEGSDAGREAPASTDRLGLVVEGKEGAFDRLEFTFDEVEKARLVPQIDFRSKAGGQKR